MTGRFSRLQQPTKLLAILGALIASFAIASPASADKADRAARLVDSATRTANYFATDTAFETLWRLADDAKAVVIVPNQVRAGFILGGSAGDAVMLARGDDGAWSQPVFMTLGSVSFGFQAGGEASEVVLLIMTNRGKEQLLSTSVKLGADLTLAAGPVGAGGKAQTTDVLAFSRSRGLYGGVSVEGGVLKIRNSFNRAYYGRSVRPLDIIVRENASNPGSAQLRQAVTGLSQRASQVRPSQQGGQPLAAGAPADQRTPGSFDDDEAWGAPLKTPQ